MKPIPSFNLHKYLWNKNDDSRCLSEWIRNIDGLPNYYASIALLMWRNQFVTSNKVFEG